MKIKMILALAGALSISGLAEGAAITWSTGPALSAADRLSSAGTLVTARNWGGGDITIAGNLFQGTGIPGRNFEPIGSIPSGDANFDLMLSDFSYTLGEDFPQIVSNLTAGRNYLLQLFLFDNRTCCASRVSTLSDYLGNTIQHTQSNVNSIIGTFTADGTSQSWNQISSVSAIYSGWMLRDVTPAPTNGEVPEPSTVLVTAVGLLAVLRRRSRSRSGKM